MNNGIVGKEIFEKTLSILHDSNGNNGRMKRPYITLSFAQSLDGSISLHPTAPVRLSNGQTQKFTHQLRAVHDAILIGIGTLIADDPQLTVRLTTGKNPQPVVVDSHLRFPLSAKLLCKNDLKPWIACTPSIDEQKKDVIEDQGGQIFALSSLPNGWVSLHSLMTLLYEKGVRSVMVEGGARILTSFLKEHLVDQIVVTVVPMILGGFRSVYLSEKLSPSNFKSFEYQMVEDNLLVWGNFLEAR